MVDVLPIAPSFDISPLRQFVRTKVLPDAKERDRLERFPMELLRELHALGWLQAFVPRRWGGLEASTADLTWIAREIAYGSAGMVTSMAGNMLAHVPIILGASEELQKEFVARFGREFFLSSFCFTEPDTGSDIHRIKTKAVRVEKGYELSGSKCFVTNANYAERLLVVARIEGIEQPRKSITLFCVDRRSPGVSLGAPYEKMGHRDSNTGELFLDRVFVPAEYRVGAEGGGLNLAFRSIQRSRTLLSAAAIGVCDRALDLAKEHLAERQLYGKRLLDQPVIQAQLAQLHTEARAAWYLTCAAAAGWDGGENEFTGSSMAKLYAGQVAARLVGTCLELFGGWGCTKEYEIERLFRDAKFYEILEGPSHVQHAILSKELFRAPQFGTS